jgi:hypothetical protein
MDLDVVRRSDRSMNLPTTRALRNPTKRMATAANTWKL